MTDGPECVPDGGMSRFLMFRGCFRCIAEPRCYGVVFENNVWFTLNTISTTTRTTLLTTATLHVWKKGINQE